MVLKYKKNTILYILLIIVILILVMSNIYFFNETMQNKGEVIVTEEYVYEKVEGNFDENKEYYKRINFKKFKKYLSSDKLRVIAVIDNTSKTYNKFLEVLNKIAYYRRTNIYLLETSKLSNKNEVAFYDIDERFKKLNSDYIIVVSGGKILSITTFDEEFLNKVEEGIGE